MIATLEDYDLSNTPLPGTITYEEGAWRSTINLRLVTVGLADRVIRSEIDRNLDHDSDHLLISTVLDIMIQDLERGIKEELETVRRESLRESAEISPVISTQTSDKSSTRQIRSRTSQGDQGGD